MSANKDRKELRDFQKQDVLFMQKHNYNVLCANAPGTGKTIEALACISIDRVKLIPAVIIAPASVTENWKIETNKWLPWARVHIVKNRAKPLPRKRCHVYVISWSLLADRAIDLLSIRPKLLIVDEAHFAKNEHAERSQILYGMSRRVPHRLLLTGTPIVNNECELKALKNLFPGGNPPLIRRFLEDAAPDIPPKTRNVIPIRLPKRYEKEYNRAQEEFALWLEMKLRERLEGTDVEAACQRALAAEALVKVGYLRRLVGRAKTNAAVDWAARAVRVGEPVVIFAEHQAVIQRLSNSLKQQRLRHVILDGSTPKRKRQGLVDQFQMGHIPVFLGSKAACTGITLSRARHLLFCEYFWTSAELDQGEDRIRRIGQKYPTKMWYLHATGTIDDRIARIIERKRRLTHRHVGLEQIDDTPESTVLEMIRRWSQNAEAPVAETHTMLGLTKALPPLPAPADTCQIIFAGSRWTRASVKAWAEMNAYIIKSIKFDGTALRTNVRPPTDFMAQSFRTFPISKEIKIIVGTRIKKRRGPKRGRRRRRRILM